MFWKADSNTRRGIALQSSCAFFGEMPQHGLFYRLYPLTHVNVLALAK